MHQIDHLLGDGQAQAGSLDRVHAAVCLAGEGLIHTLHELRRHSHARIPDHIRQPDGVFRAPRILQHVHPDLAAWLRILDGIGKEIDIDLVEAQLIGVKMFMIEMIDAEAEIDVLLFHHRLGNVHQVLRAFHNGKGGRAQIELTAFHLGNIQNIVDQGQQVIAGKADFMQVFLDGGAVLRVLFRNGSQADNSVHGRADVMGHGGEEVRFGTACPISGISGTLGAIIGPQQHGQIENEQKKKPCGYNSHQRPVRVLRHQRAQRHHGEHNPVVRGVDPCMRH